MSRRVLVTGGSRGIGLAIARGLAETGDEVAVLARRPPPPETGLVHLACDLRSPESIRSTLSPWVEGTIDALVHCAVAYGSAGRHPLLESSVEEWDDALDVNARGLLLTMQQVLPGMLERGQGVIIGISSDIANEAGPGRVPYAASKAAAHAVVIGAAEELRDTGVTLLELMPTRQVDTPGIRSRRPADFQPVGYSAASSFVGPVLWLLDGNAQRHHGVCLLVDHEGKLLTADQAVVQ